MDRSNTKTNSPLGNSKAIAESVKIMDSMKPGMSPEEQVAFLHKVITCLNGWYPIKSLGVKRMEEHFAAQIGDSFTKGAKAEYNGLAQTRAIRLIDDSRDYHTGKWDRNIYTNISFYLTEKCSILGMRSNHRMTDAVEWASEAAIEEVPDSFLVYLMILDDKICAKGNKTLVVNALKSLESTLFSVKTNAQKKVDSIGSVENAIAMFGCKLENCLSGPQQAATATS